MRTRFQRRRARSSLRRYWRTTRLRPRAVRSNRIFRRFIRRTAPRPELKWSLNTFNSGSVGTQTGATDTFYTQALSPLTLNPGTGVGTRIGNQLNFIKVDCRFFYQDNSNQTTPLTAPDYLSYPVRTIIWTPRRPYTEAAAHVQGLTDQQLIDYDQVTVHRDLTVYLSPTYINESGTNEPAPGGRNSGIVKNFKVKFPRKVKLTAANNDLDPQTDILYVTFLCSSVPRSGCIVYANSKTWYFDS